MNRTFCGVKSYRAAVALFLLGSVPVSALAQYPGVMSPGYGSKRAAIGV